jgi:hypothetical protein
MDEGLKQEEVIDVEVIKDIELVRCEAGQYQVQFDTEENAFRNFTDQKKIFLDGVYASKYFEHVESSLRNLDKSAPETRVKDKITFIDCADNSFAKDIIDLGLQQLGRVILLEGWQIINLLADKSGISKRRKDLKEIIKSADILCVTELDRVTDNPFKNALAEILVQNFRGKFLVFQARKIEKALDTFCDTKLKEWIEKSKRLKISAKEIDSIVSWQDVPAQIKLDEETIFLPNVFARLGLFSAIDPKERSRLTKRLKIEVGGKLIPYLKEESRSTVYGLNGHIIDKSGPVLCLGTDLPTFILLLSLFLRNPNAQGKIVTNWSELVRGFDLESTNRGKDCIDAKKRSLARLKSSDVRITSVKGNLVIYHGSLVAEYMEAKRGRYSTVTVFLSPTLAKQMLQYKKVPSSIYLQLPQLSLAIYCYAKSNKEVFDMSFGKWKMILGRNYEGYQENPRKFKESMSKALTILSEQKIIKSSWRIKGEMIEGIQLA